MHLGLLGVQNERFTKATKLSSGSLLHDVFEIHLWLGQLESHLPI